MKGCLRNWRLWAWNSRVVVWVRVFLVGRSWKVRVGGQLSKEGKVISGVPQGIVLGPLLLLVYVNDIWINIDSSKRLSLTTVYFIGKPQIKRHTIQYLTTLGERAVENGIKINPGKSNAIRFTRARVKNPLGYSLGDQYKFRKRVIVNTWE